MEYLGFFIVHNNLDLDISYRELVHTSVVSGEWFRVYGGHLARGAQAVQLVAEVGRRHHNVFFLFFFEGFHFFGGNVDR